jgi:hypothetical protein
MIISRHCILGCLFNKWERWEETVKENNGFRIRWSEVFREKAISSAFPQAISKY